MNTLVLDVVLGLIFIYLIYSIFISIVAEMIATWIGLRARLLRQGITSMLTDLQDENTSKKQSFWLSESKNFRYSKAHKFYEQPNIKKLSQNKTRENPGFWSSLGAFFEKSKPSYIAKETFSATLVNMLREKGRGIHDWGKIGFSINNNSAHFDPNTIKHLQTIYEDADDDMEVFIQKLEQWYQEMMDRVNGWFKRKLQLILFWLAFIIVAILNVDTFDIVNRLSKDDTLREQFVQMAIAATDEDSNMSKMLSQLDTQLTQEELYTQFKAISEDMDKTSILLGNGWEFSTQKATVSIESTVLAPDLFKRIKTNSEMVITAKESMAVLSDYLDTPGLSFIMTDSILRVYRQQKSELQIALKNVNQDAGSRFSSIDGFIDKNKSYTITGEIALPWYCKFWHILKQSLNFLQRKFWGFTITSLAICLGAPFWFDLLKKLVALRGSGVHPDEKAKKEKSKPEKPKEKSQLGKTIKNADAIDIAIEENRSIWEATPGVIAINKVLHKSGTRQSKYVIEITHEKDLSLPTIKKKIKPNNQDIEIKVVKKPSGLADLQSDQTEFSFQNNAGFPNGSIAGSLKNKMTKKKCILTCAHVLSLDSSSIINEGKAKIEGYGNISKMIWNNYMDAGIIELDEETSKKEFNQIPTSYTVTREDTINNLPVLIYTKDGVIPAKIEHDDYDFQFRDKQNALYRFRNLIKISKQQEPNSSDPEPPTIPGHSGALVVTNIENDPERSVGIIIGASEKEAASFVLPINRITDALNLEII